MSMIPTCSAEHCMHTLAMPGPSLLNFFPGQLKLEVLTCFDIQVEQTVAKKCKTKLGQLKDSCNAIYDSTRPKHCVSWRNCTDLQGQLGCLWQPWRSGPSWAILGHPGPSWALGHDTTHCETVNKIGSACDHWDQGITG